MTKVRNNPIPSSRQAGATESSDDGEAEMVLVPRKPTKEMVDRAWEAALAEDAEWVWHSMIETWLHSSGNSSSDKD